METALRNNFGRRMSPPELMYQVATHCSLSSLVNLGHADMKWRQVVLKRLEDRVRVFLEPFMNKGSVGTFLELLSTEGAVVMGALVRLGYDPDPDAYWEEYPVGLVPTCRDCLRLISSTRGKSVAIFRSRVETVLPTVLMGATTSQLSVLSSSSLYCFYPLLLAKKEYLSIIENVSSRDLLPFHNFNFGLKCLDAHPTSCLYACPVKWRNSGSSAIGIMAWNNSSVTSSADQQLANEDFMWRKNRLGCNYRDTLLVNQDYLASPLFLPTCSWLLDSADRHRGHLAGERGQYRKKCRVVGELMETSLNALGLLGNYFDDIVPLETAQHRLYLKAPDHPKYGSDFNTASNTLDILLKSIPGFTLTEDAACLKTMYYSSLLDLANYQVDAEYKALIQTIQGTHMLRRLDIYNGRLVDVTFGLSYDEDLGFETEILVIKALPLPWPNQD
ncbi:hypothetical protein JR316_0003131 [Psilocybe cubensis]|uniref:Uncharacterized protein n=1 Tax=Psilocybe cubensis TaxID=181762 RepID=A0ACB8H712_PSICU|nr:hypothetical protein JR316_0003131 [Psilocybe cubensis]KAH9483661.1 hypothetical protein JR316_0003131 [Psilocybe cubensis]